MSRRRHNSPKTLRQLMVDLGLGHCLEAVKRIGEIQVPPYASSRDSGPSEPFGARPCPADKAHTWAAWGVPEEAVRLLKRPRSLRETQALRGARELAQEHAHGRSWGLICGGVGCGKSVAAGWWLAVADVRTNRGQGCYFLPSEDVASLPAGTVHATERFKAWVNASRLVLDDVGLNDAVNGQLHPLVQRLLRRRYESRLPTLCTVNLHPFNDWPRYIGDDRMRERWREIGAFRVSSQPSLRAHRA